MHRLRTRLEQLFGIDLRSLALFRAGLGLVLLADTCCRFRDLGAFYDGSALLPAPHSRLFTESGRFSLYLVSGHAVFAGALLVLQALCALALLLGWRTRLAALACFILEISLLNRNPLVLFDGDRLLACLLLWAPWLPLGARWGVDAALNRAPPAPAACRSWATAGLLLQVLSAFFFAAVARSGPDWWPDGSALYYTLQLDRLVSAPGVWLRPYTGLLTALTWLVYFIGWLAPLLVLSPWCNRPLRFAALVLLFFTQLLFAVCLNDGLTPYVYLAALAVLIDGWVWDALDRAGQRRAARRGPAALRIYYDRDCAFCLRSVTLMKTLLVLPRAELLPAQEQARARTLMEANRSWVVIDHDDRAYLKWPAMVVLLRRSPLLGCLGWLLSGGWAVKPGDAVYDFVARHRGAFGRISGVLLPWHDGAAGQGRGLPQVAAVLLFVELAWNLSTVGGLPGFVGSALAPPLRLLGVDQHWNALAPVPSRADGWFVFPGELADGSTADVLRGGLSPVSYDKPAHIAGFYPDLRWRQYLESLLDPQNGEVRNHYGRRLCRQWNASHPPAQALNSFKMIYMLESSLPPGQTRTLEQQVVDRIDCTSHSP